MNPFKRLKHLNQKEYQKSFPTEEEKAALPMKTVKDGFGNETQEQDFSQLERETVGNVIINCLARYKPEENKESIFVNIAMQLLWEAEEGKPIELKEKIRKFLVKVVNSQTIHDEIGLDAKQMPAKIEVGCYYSWVSSQVLTELGETAEE